MNRIIINGMVITGGRNIRVENNRVIVDGRDVTPEGREISITVEGNVDHLSVDACNQVSIAGDAGEVKVQSGDVKIGGNVTGSVNNMSGDISCGGSIGGNVSTMSGDIRHR